MSKKIVTTEEREMCRIAPNSFTAESVRLRLAILQLAKTVNEDVIPAKTLIKRLKFVAKGLQ